MWFEDPLTDVGVCAPREKFDCDAVQLSVDGTASTSKSLCESSGPCVYHDESVANKYTALNLQCWALACEETTAATAASSAGKAIQAGMQEICTPRVRSLLSEYKTTGSKTCEEKRVPWMTNVFDSSADEKEGFVDTMGVCEM